MLFYKTTPDTVDVAELDSTLDCSHEQYTDIYNSHISTGLAVLETLDITHEQYTEIFLQNNNTGLTILQKQADLENHPNGDDFRRYMSSLTERVELAD